MKPLHASFLALATSLSAGCIQINVGLKEGASPALEAPARAELPPPGALASAAPRSILVVPAGNWSSHAKASELLLSTLSRPLAEKGYYVFPVHTVKTVLEREALDDPHAGARRPAELAARFGADAVLYVTVKAWDIEYAVTHTELTIEADYRLMGKDGQLLWTSTQRVQHRPERIGLSDERFLKFIERSITAAVARAVADYLPVARRVNEQAIITGREALPPGPIVTSK